MTTNLNLLFLDHPDSKTIFVQDVSDYNTDVDVENPLLTITPPNFSTSYNVIYTVSTIIPINSNALNLTSTDNYDLLTDLPDGLWTFKQSVSPNNCLYREYNHLRIVTLKKKILSYVSDQLDLSNPNCSLNDAWYQDIFNLLQLLETAKYLAENCNKCEEAKIMFNQVSNQAKRFTCSDC